VILVLANTWDEFVLWCREQDPAENPKDRKFVLITPSTMRRGMAHGRHKQEGDRLIRLNASPFNWPGRWQGVGDEMEFHSAYEDLHAALMPGGWNIDHAERHRT
jgi:hypothetical protein